MIEIEEALHALSVAREYAEEGNYAACAAVVEKLIGMFPSSCRFGRDVALAIVAPEWGVDWAGLDAEITGAINAQIVEELRRRDRVAAQNRAKAKKERKSKYAWMKVTAEKVVARKPNLPMEPDWVVRFYNQRGTAEQHIKEGKYAFHWTRLRLMGKLHPHRRWAASRLKCSLPFTTGTH